MTSHGCKAIRAATSWLRGWRTLSLLILVLRLAGVPTRSQSLAGAGASDKISNSPSEVLARARKSVERLFDESANLTCKESVTQSILDKYERPMYQEHSRFNYRFLADSSGRSVKFVESREQIQAPFHDAGRMVLMTDGFGNMMLILHPAYAANYTFAADGEEVLDGVHAHRFRFQSQPNSSSPLMLQIRGRNYSVALTGTVWIEPQSGVIIKVLAFSGSEINEWGIRKMSTEIRYQPVQLDDEAPHWLPASAVIDVETAKHHWRNIHGFTAYKLFIPTLSATQAK